MTILTAGGSSNNNQTNIHNVSTNNTNTNVNTNTNNNVTPVLLRKRNSRMMYGGIYSNNNNPMKGGNNVNNYTASTTSQSAGIMVAFTMGFLTATIILLFGRTSEQYQQPPQQPMVSTNSSSCLVSYGKYNGMEYNNPGVTIGQPICLIESKFLKVQQHHVLEPKQQPSDTNITTNTIIPDWIWIDYHERVNVLVEAPVQEHLDDMESRKFIIFEQTKYALEGKQSFAIIGGIVEPNNSHNNNNNSSRIEAPIDSAKREVYEELDGLVCQQYVFLGRYRTDVNRGMGWTNAYLAMNCQYDTTTTNNNNNNNNRRLAEQLSSIRGGGNENNNNGSQQVSNHENNHNDHNAIPHNSSRQKVNTNGGTNNENDIVGASDTEKQTIQYMTLNEIRQAVMDGKFMEIQWTATVSLAILYLQSRAL